MKSSLIIVVYFIAKTFNVSVSLSISIFKVSDLETSVFEQFNDICKTYYKLMDETRPLIFIEVKEN